MDSKTGSSLVTIGRNKIALGFFLACFNFSYSQNAVFTTDEIGLSKIDEAGMMSKIVWTKSKVAIFINAKNDYVNVFLTNASKSQLYKEVTLLKKVETAETAIRTFRALNSEGDECILILTKNKSEDREEQLRIYLVDKVYIYNFIRA